MWGDKGVAGGQDQPRKGHWGDRISPSRARHSREEDPPPISHPPSCSRRCVSPSKAPTEPVHPKTALQAEKLLFPYKRVKTSPRSHIASRSWGRLCTGSDLAP